MALYGNGTAPKTELLIDGVWTDISGYVRGENRISITRGRQNEQSRTSAQTCALTLDNADGRFSNRNPASPYYGLLPRSTQLRVSAGTGDTYVRLPYRSDNGQLDSVSTADKAVLDITGDIDVRVDVHPHTWRPGKFMILASKWQLVSDERSWVFYMSPDGLLYWAWTTGGTLATRVTVSSTAAVPGTNTRLSLRVTHDVNNGAGGNNVTFYTSPTIGGTWTALGSVRTTAGTTSLYSGSADLAAGSGDDNQAIFSDALGFGGRFYGLELYSGIAGTLRADLDVANRSVGDTSWSDGLGTPNTWTLNGAARVSTDRLRFWGEISALPVHWDKSGADVTVPVMASGIIRRLTQGASPTRSALYRNFTQYSPHGYWPMEDGSEATTAASGVTGGASAKATAVSFASATTLPGSAQTLAFTGATSTIIGFANRATAGTTASFVVYVRLSALPASDKRFLTLSTTGTARSITIGVSATTWTATFYDVDGGTLATSNVSMAGIDPTDGWIGYNLLLSTSGANVEYSIRWDTVGVGYGGGVGPVSLGAGTSGRFESFVLTAKNDAVFQAAQFGHLFMSTQNLDLTDDEFRNAANAYLGETSAARMERLCTEEGQAFEITGRLADTETMGYQTTDTFMDLIYQCWDADGGIGGEARDQLALTYRTRVDLELRSDATLDYSSSELFEVPLPVEDDQGFTNDVTVRRPNSGSARSVVEEGPTSVLDPPDGVGRYATDVTVNIAEDDRLPSVAGWLTLVGAWDEARYPSVSVALHRTAIDDTLAGTVRALDLGDTITLTNLPSWVPPEDVPELVQGYTETLSRYMWDITYNATPAGPYQGIAVLDSDVYPPRLDATDHTVSNSLTTTGTSLTLVTPAGSQRWVDSATYPSEFPVLVKVGGEVMSLTAVTGTSSPQTGTVVRSVNGVVKSHTAGQGIRLANPFYLGR